jgi:hypothetical protein
MNHFAKVLILNAAFFLGLSAVCAQAPPGPMTPPAPPPGAEPPPPPPKKPEVPARKDILGAWRFNKEDSDDPRDKIHHSSDDSNRGGGGSGGPRIGFPGGPIGGQGGGNGPYGGQRRTSQDDDSARLGELVNPVRELQLIRHNQGDPEIEMYDDHDHRHIFYTDGRKIDKQKDPALEEISARWDGNRLVTDEKAPHNGKLTRTFEISSDGHQLLETIRVTDSKGNHPININYVYDAVETSSLSFPPH